MTEIKFFNTNFLNNFVFCASVYKVYLKIEAALALLCVFFNNLWHAFDIVFSYSTDTTCITPEAPTLSSRGQNIMHILLNPSVILSFSDGLIIKRLGFLTIMLMLSCIIAGSIILSFELQPSTTAGSDTLGQMLASIELLVDSGTMTITNPSGDTLTINANSFTYTEQSSEDGGSVTSGIVLFECSKI